MHIPVQPTPARRVAALVLGVGGSIVLAFTLGWFIKAFGEFAFVLLAAFALAAWWAFRSR